MPSGSRIQHTRETGVSMMSPTSGTPCSAAVAHGVDVVHRERQLRLAERHRFRHGVLDPDLVPEQFEADLVECEHDALLADVADVGQHAEPEHPRVEADGEVEVRHADADVRERAPRAEGRPSGGSYGVDIRHIIVND